MPLAIRWDDLIAGLRALRLEGVERITEIVIDRYTIDVAYVDSDTEEPAHAEILIVGGPPVPEPEPEPNEPAPDADTVVDAGEIIGRVQR